VVMGTQGVNLSCCDCGRSFSVQRTNGRTKRCQDCQRRFVNAETSKRDKARRLRKKYAKEVAAVLGIPDYTVIRDNGHKCQACGIVLLIDNGQAPYLCGSCKRTARVINAVVGVLACIACSALDWGVSCVVCGNGVPLFRRKGCSTCSKECETERGRRQSREKYEARTGVCLRPASGDRQCRFCDRLITPDHALGRGRSVCDYCNLHRGTFKSRAMLYGVAYTHVPRRGIFERDGWRCQLCRKRVLKTARRNKNTKRLHPRTASIDHIIPMVRGGPHAEHNCQCTCLSCNVKKNAKMIGQTRLF